MKKTKLFIDTDAILSKRLSGIGSMTVELVRALSTDKAFLEKFDIVLVTPFNRVDVIRSWGFGDTVRIKKSPFTGKVVKALSLLHVLPPMDLLLGKGTYLFTNFRNWPLARSRSVTYIHDVAFRVYPEYIEPKNLAYLMKNTEEWIRRTDVVVTVSDHAKKEIIEYYPEAETKTVVVPNGVSADFVPVKENQAAPVLKRYELKPKEYFLFLSNIEPRKNIAGLLDAYEKFVQTKNSADVKLLMVGGMGWNNGDILQRIDEINAGKQRIVRPNWYVPDKDLPALLSGAAALVHPAHYEGFGISPLQAMACGTQVVVARTTSLPWVVGDAGIYVDAADPDDILRGMKMAYNKRHILNEKGIQRAQKFTWDASAKRLAKVLLEAQDD